MGRGAYEEAYGVLEVAENEYVMIGWTNSIGQGDYDYYIVEISIANGDDPLSVYQLIVLALIAVVTMFVVLFFLVRWRINRKISGQNLNATLRRNTYWAWL